jgi:hypothetical protein
MDSGGLSSRITLACELVLGWLEACVLVVGQRGDRSLQPLVIKSGLRHASMLFVRGLLLKSDANIGIGRRDRGYAGNQYVSTFVGLSNDLWHTGAISGGSRSRTRCYNRLQSKQRYLLPSPDEPPQQHS